MFLKGIPEGVSEKELRGWGFRIVLKRNSKKEDSPSTKFLDLFFSILCSAEYSDLIFLN